MVTYILTKFGADWSIFVDDKSVNKARFSYFFKFKGNELRMFRFNLTYSLSHLRPHGYIYYGQVWY